MTKWLHISDVHFGRPFRSRTENGQQFLIDRQQNAFRQAIQFAMEEEVTGVLITGDLFDTKTPSFIHVHQVQQAINRLADAGIPTFLLSGNHDPAPGYRGLKTPGGGHIFSSGEPVGIPLMKGGQPVAMVYGCGYEENWDAVNRVQSYPIHQEDLPAIGLAHCSVVGKAFGDQVDQYQPCTQDDLASRGYHYWALGHIHMPPELDWVPGGYGGSLMGLDPSETGPHGGWLVTLDATYQPVKRFIPFGGTTFSLVDHQVEAESLMGLTQDLVALLASTQVRDQCVRVNLSGRSPLYRDLKSEAVLSDLATQLEWETGAIEVDIRSGVGPRIDLEELISLSPYLASLNQVARDLGEGDDRIQRAKEELLDRLVKHAD